MSRLRAAAIQCVIICCLAQIAFAQQKQTTEAFDRYIAEAEARISQAKGKKDSFLRIDVLATDQRTQVMARLWQRDAVIEKWGKAPPEIPGGLIHGGWAISSEGDGCGSWLIQDCDHSTVTTRLMLCSPFVSRHADDFQVFMRLRKHKFMTVVLDTEYNVHYGLLDANHQYSFSRSTRIREISDPGTPTEHPLALGHDHGFMWRLNSYWAFQQVDDGVLVECEAISLTRDIPSGLGWMVGPFVNSIPRESLQFTLEATRKALEQRAGS
jgi:hypothetical protein